MLSFFSKLFGELFVDLQILDTDSWPLPCEHLHKVSFVDGRHRNLCRREANRLDNNTTSQEIGVGKRSIFGRGAFQHKTVTFSNEKHIYKHCSTFITTKRINKMQVNQDHLAALARRAACILQKRRALLKGLAAVPTLDGKHASRLALVHCTISTASRAKI